VNNGPIPRSDLVARQVDLASQGAHIETSRAIEQVRGALIIAQERPRDEAQAIERMRRVCDMASMADRAFWRMARGDDHITGETIHLAIELARCWGNIDFGVTELARDAAKRQSEMMTYAWDLETNTRTVHTFIVPHQYDVKGGVRDITGMQRIYENNSNAGARRLRECLFRVLPDFFIEEAKSICSKRLADGNGESVEVRREKMFKAFGNLGISDRQIAGKVGHGADNITAEDLSTLRVILGSILRGEATIESEFPVDSGADIESELSGGALDGPDDSGEPKGSGKPPTEDPPWKEMYDGIHYGYLEATTVDALVNFRNGRSYDIKLLPVEQQQALARLEATRTEVLSRMNKK